MTRTIITSQNNNKVKYFEKKLRGSNCSRVHRIKISTSLSTSPYEKIPSSGSLAKSCFNCDDSSNCMKLITERLARIEELVNNLYEMTQGLQSNKKNPKQKNRILQNIDLSSCKLDDLQKLVIFTTNAMSVPSSQKPASPRDNQEEKLEKNSTKENFKTKQQDEKLKSKHTSQDSGYLSDLSNSSPPAAQEENKVTLKDILKNENHVPTVCNQDCS